MCNAWYRLLKLYRESAEAYLWELTAAQGPGVLSSNNMFWVFPLIFQTRGIEGKKAANSCCSMADDFFFFFDSEL